MKKEKLKVTFGIPEYGWLPVDISCGDFKLEFDASDVPINPVEQLIVSLRQVLKGIRSEIWWHLEPEGYYFEFDKVNDSYSLSISFTKSDSSERKQLFQLQGSVEMIILPFYRALKKFCDQEYKKKDWPETETTDMEKLMELVNELKVRQLKR